MLTTTTMGPSGATPGAQTNSPGFSAAGGVAAGLDSFAPQNGTASALPATSNMRASVQERMRIPSISV